MSIKGPFFNALGNAKLAVMSLFMMLFVSFILNIILGINLSNVPKNVRVYQENCNGGVNVIDPNVVSPVRIQNFVTGEWVKLTSFPSDAKTDSEIALDKNIADGFITPNFVSQYRNMLSVLDKSGYLEDYTVVTIPLSVSADENVKKVDGGWVVKQTFITRFYYNPSEKGKKNLKQIPITETKDARIEHVIEQTVVFYVVDYPNNSGLALDSIMDSQTVTEDVEGNKNV